MTGSSRHLCLRQITLGGEIATQDILDSLRHYYHDARITHIYASTELGVGFSVADGLEGFPAEWLSVDGAFAVDPDSCELQQRDGASDALVGTGDRIQVRGTRAVFLGRLNGSINVGGNKVMPEEVERVLLAFPGVRLAAVSAMRSSFVGNLVTADVVIEAMDRPLAEYKRSLLEHCRERLEAHKVPAILNIVEQLRLAASGKIGRS